MRSEGEFAQGSLPAFVNAPILDDGERHQVGLTYKEQGQSAAIAHGHRLIGPDRETRVERWARLVGASRSGRALVTCWRGGLRSQIACEWLAAFGCQVIRIEGGYKAMREQLLRTLATPPPLRVLAGLTGCGKTRLLANLPIAEKVDLEGLARHRGSSFGGYLKVPQPSQATFENAVGMALRNCRRPVLIEDEGVSIGSLHQPLALRKALLSTPVVYIEAPLAERVNHIFAEYVAEPLRCGMESEMLRATLVASVHKLARRLGGALTTRVSDQINAAFSEGVLVPERHAAWIGALLTEYYDKGYTYAFHRHNREIAFRGHYEECRQWILAQYD